MIQHDPRTHIHFHAPVAFQKIMPRRMFAPERHDYGLHRPYLTAKSGCEMTKETKSTVDLEGSISPPWQTGPSCRSVRVH